MTARFRNRCGLDAAFLAVVHPLPDEGEESEDVHDLRAACDAYTPRNSRTWTRAIRFLQALDRLDQQHARGTLSAGAYAAALGEWHRSTDMDTWMCAVKLTRLADRVIGYRQGRSAPVPETRCLEGELTPLPTGLTTTPEARNTTTNGRD